MLIEEAGGLAWRFLALDNPHDHKGIKVRGKLVCMFFFFRIFVDVPSLLSG